MTVLKTCSLGAEPGMPPPQRLAEWAGDQKGRCADLTSFLVEESVLPQVDAGITIPCAGGKFYSARLRESIVGLEGDRIRGELAIFPDFLIDDAARAGILADPCWFAVPAPHIVVKGDEYYGDSDEACSSLYDQYRHIFRTMRDAGIFGHVCICEQAVPEEMESLAGRRVLFYIEKATTAMLEEVLEYQKTLIIEGSGIREIERLRDEFEISRVLVIDPEVDELRAAIGVFEPDRVQVAGYCTNGDPDYWKSIVSSATVKL
ncbi:MAG: hypothetical protein QHH04_08020 [Methanolinea sp.]|nr:hypothetical protein [Methanolinea sp.]